MPFFRSEIMMRRRILSQKLRESAEKHARLFELIRQQNLIATRRVGRKTRALDAPLESAFLEAAQASFAMARRP